MNQDINDKSQWLPQSLPVHQLRPPSHLDPLSSQKSPKVYSYTSRIPPILIILFFTDTRIEKRPLLHPPIPSPHTNASQPKIVYVSTKTPFISAVKRVRALLTKIEKRCAPKVDLIKGKGSDKQKLKALAAKKGDRTEPEAVILKGTNKAILKVCDLALFFQNQDDVKVRIKTGSVGTVDDFVEKEDVEEEARTVDEDEEEMPESRVRWLSVVEAHVSLK